MARVGGPLLRLMLVAGLMLGLTACVVVPVTSETYDPECRVVTRHMTLQPVQLASIGSCHGADCSAQLVFIGATAAVSAVVSGSIVLVGSVVYWLEKHGRCVREP